jgi:3'-phosphoadenosine 5'-phosphosulfate (PAPS) 3'-phosphatase
VECGSVGLKIARVAENAADVYAKDFRFRLWDVAPGDVLLREAGGRIGLWDGSPIAYNGDQVEWRRLLAVPGNDFGGAVAALGSTDPARSSGG